MKSTGIIRRIDDLGRVVIPKEVRHMIGIKEGDPMEIFVGRGEDDRPEVTFRRYVEGDELIYLKNIIDSLNNLDNPERKEFKATMIKLVMNQIKAEKGMNF